MALMQLLGWDTGLNLFVIHLPNVYDYPQFPQPLDAIYGHFKKSTLRPHSYPHYPHKGSQFTKLISQCFKRYQHFIHIHTILSTSMWIRYGDKWTSL